MPARNTHRRVVTGPPGSARSVVAGADAVDVRDIRRWLVRDALWACLDDLGDVDGPVHVELIVSDHPIPPRT